MLCLKRKNYESVNIGDNVTVTMLPGGRLGIEAPESVRVWRSELPQEDRKCEDSLSDRKPVDRTESD